MIKRLKIATFVILLLSTIGFGYKTMVLHKENESLKRSVLLLAQETADAKIKLGFADEKGIPTQVTAYVANPGERFANGVPIAAAVSPALEAKGFRLGDNILVYTPDKAHTLCTIVDRTSQEETRSVIDLLFRDKMMANDFGRRNMFVTKMTKVSEMTKIQGQEPDAVALIMHPTTYLFCKDLVSRSLMEGLIKPEDLEQMNALWKSLNTPMGIKRKPNDSVSPQSFATKYN